MDKFERRDTDSFNSFVKNRYPFLPSAFARYMAISAFLINSSAVSPSDGCRLIPDRNTGEDFLMLEFERRMEDVDEFLCAMGREVAFRIRRQDDEFIPTKPSECICFLNRRLDAGRHLF